MKTQKLSLNLLALCLTYLLSGSLASVSLCAEAAEEARSRIDNPLFGYTHLLQSPLTLPAGRLALGTSVALGVTDFLQVSTDILRDAYSVFNAQAKLMLVNSESFALGAFVGFESYNYNSFDANNPDLRVNSWLPGIIAAIEVIPDVALFLGGNLNYTSTQLITSGISTSGYVQGASAESDISWAYNPHRNRIGNVLSAGVSYDFTYQIYGVGVSHHFPGFHVGIHYYPNATQYRVQPIISGGAAVDL